MKICLNMIVRNEAAVIARCLRSVRPVIHSWVIVDTGSTDVTKNVILRELDGIPGRLADRAWTNFGVNRTQAIQTAREYLDGEKGWYLLFIDADDILEPTKLPDYDYKTQCFDLLVEYGELSYRRPALVSASLPWCYEGALHEYLALEGDREVSSRANIDWKIKIVGGGARSKDPEKYRRDAELLEKEAQTPRNVFYLAQSYRDAGMPKQALEAYDRRAGMQGFSEETFIALLRGAQLAEQLDLDRDEVVRRYLRAHRARPARAEALGMLARYLRLKKQYDQALFYAQHAIDDVMTDRDDMLFVETSWYDWQCTDEVAVSAFYVGDFELCRQLSEKLLRSGKLPDAQRPRVRDNLMYALRALNLPLAT